MKKLALVLVSVIIMTVFIAFNFLIWDRENQIRNFENLNDAKSSSIDALGSEISNLKNFNNELRSRVAELEGEKEAILKESTELENNKKVIENELSHKKDLITRLQKQADLRPLEETVRKWVDALDRGSTEAAYSLQYEHDLYAGQKITLDEFKNTYSSSIKDIRIKSIKLYNEELPDEKRGNIIYKVTLEVKKTADSPSGIFEEGINERYFVIGFDKQKNQWVITDIWSSVE